MSQNTPQYMKQIPWYAMKDGESNRANEQNPAVKNQFEEWYDRGKKGYQATTFRNGACENCGAMGHKKKQCTQRPRKVAARFSNEKIAADDIEKDINLNWQGKRDRWNGYEPEMYKEVIEEYEQFDEIRKRKKEEDGEEDVDGEYKIAVDPIECGRLQSKNIKTEKFHNLGGIRNREDRVKYLNNLDSNADHFDPKSRSMKSYDNPGDALNNLQLMGEKFELTQQDRFAFQQVEKNNSELNSVAVPTLTEKIYKKVKQDKQAYKSSKNDGLQEKYGTIRTDRLIEVVEEQQFINYEQNNEAKMKRSKYEQDVYINDHTSVWGSWYNRYLGWGYACCHSTQKNSYCLGQKGKQKALAAELKKKAQKLREEKRIEDNVNQ